MEIFQLKMDEVNLFEEPELVEAGFEDNSVPEKMPDKFRKSIKDTDLLLVKILTFRLENNNYRLRF